MDYPLIGRKEWVKFPGLSDSALLAKIDTGALSSTLDATDFEYYSRSSDDQEMISFRLQFEAQRDSRFATCQLPVVKLCGVKNSGGIEEIRPFVRIPIQIGEHLLDVEVSLTNRANMKHRMLLGRRALKNRFYIDPTHSNLLSQRES